MNIDEFMKFIRTQPINDYIVRLQYKYRHEDVYTLSNVVLFCDVSNSGIQYIWAYDWDEGQEDVKVLGFIAVDAVTIPKLER